MAYFVGTDAAEIYTGTPDDDVVYLQGGNDKAYGDDGDDLLYGNSGNDRLFGGAGQDFLYGGSGDDVLAGGLGPNYLYGGDGLDIVSYTDATARVSVDLTTGVISGGDGSKTLDSIEGVEGTAFDDRLIGNAAANILNGLNGNDYLDGNAGADIMEGGAGNDVYYVDNSSDQVIEVVGGGTDTIYLVSNFQSYTLTSHQDVEVVIMENSGGALTGNRFDNTLYGRGTLSGGKGNDTLGGGSDYLEPGDTLRGGDGNDILWGDNGYDRLIGGNDSDRLIGGYGNDILIGGAGVDTFVFNTERKGPYNIDTIKDFDASTETIELDQRYFPGLALGPLTQFSANSAVGSSPQIVYNETSGSLTYDANGERAGVGYTGGGHFVTLSGAPPVTAANFTVV